MNKSSGCFDYVLADYRKSSGYITYQVCLRGVNVIVWSSITFLKYLWTLISDIWAHFYWHVTSRFCFFAMHIKWKRHVGCTISGLENIQYMHQRFNFRCAMHTSNKPLWILSLLQETINYILAQNNIYNNYLTLQRASNFW